MQGKESKLQIYWCRLTPFSKNTHLVISMHLFDVPLAPTMCLLICPLPYTHEQPRSSVEPRPSQTMGLNSVVILEECRHPPTSGIPTWQFLFSLASHKSAPFQSSSVPYFLLSQSPAHADQLPLRAQTQQHFSGKLSMTSASTCLDFASKQ